MAMYDNANQFITRPDFSGEVGDLEELLAPMSDAQVAERLKRSVPYWNDFSTDAFLSADPAFRTLFADAYIEAEGDPIALYGTLNDKLYQTELIRRLAPDVGAITGQPKLPAGPGKFDELSAYGNQGLENIFAASVPSSARNLGLVDYISQRFGGRPYPGAGQGLPGYQGPGFGGGAEDWRRQVQRAQDMQTVREFRERYGNSGPVRQRPGKR